MDAATIETHEGRTPSVSEFYAGKGILITGGTGFLGKCIVFRLLYDCPDLDRIYLLLRKKRQFSYSQRVERYLSYDLFKYLKDSSLLSKIEFIEGDIQYEKLGIKPEVMTALQDKVHIILHSAADVRFMTGLEGAR